MNRNSVQILCRVQQAFPFNIFPDSITVDPNKIDIVYRNFFWEKQVFTILIEDLTTIKINTGIVYASANFEVRGYEKNPDPINHLSKKDAIKLHQIVIGLSKAVRDNMKINLEKKDNLKKLRSIGKTREDLTAAI